MLLSTILKNNPKLQGMLFDLPNAIESAKKLYINAKDNSDILSSAN